MKGNEEYKQQMRLTLLTLLGELPNFIALLLSAIGTKAVLVFVDLIDTSSNVLRNVLVVLISRRLQKDLRYKYNYGVGKIEAMASMLCDAVLVVTLAVILGFAVRDLLHPRAAEEFLLFVVCVKIVNLAGDGFVYWRQRKICKTSDSLVFRSALTVALKNLLFDSASFVTLVLMACFRNVRAVWYLSPVVSIALGGYLMMTTIRRLAETVGIMLDKSPNEETQLAIVSTLSKLYEEYDEIENVQSRLSGTAVVIDLSLRFTPDTTYAEIRNTADRFTEELEKKIPNCTVKLNITGTHREAPEVENSGKSEKD